MEGRQNRALGLSKQVGTRGQFVIRNQLQGVRQRMRDRRQLSLSLEFSQLVPQAPTRMSVNCMGRSRLAIASG